MKRENSLTSRPSSFRSCSHSQWPAWWNQIACSPGYASTTSSAVRAAGSRSKTACISSRMRLRTLMSVTFRSRSRLTLEFRRSRAFLGALRLHGRTRAVGGGKRPQARLDIVFVQFEFHRIDQPLPARFNHVARKPDRTPSPRAIGRFDKHSHARGRAGAVVEHAHLVVGELHRRETRIVRNKGLAQSRVERVDGAVADCRVARALAVGSLDHDDRLAERGLILMPLVVEDAETHELEMIRGKSERAQHQ